MTFPRTIRAVVLCAVLVGGACTHPTPAPPPPSGSPSGPSATGSQPPPRAGTPNVLILLSDDQTSEEFSRTLMPHVFADLVDQGVDFTRAYVNQSQCCPSRSSILTGLYAHHTGVDTNTTPLDGQTPPRPVFPLTLQEAGYRTGLFGKYLNSESCDPQPGWSQWVCGTPNTEVDPVLNINGQVQSFKGYTADILATKTVTFIRNSTNQAKPFFAYYAPKDPHLPANDPRASSLEVPPFHPPSYNVNPQPETKPAWTRLPPLSATDQAKAQNWHRKMTQQIPPLDAAMGTILDALGSEARNTLVFFLSDNGFLYGEHRMTSKDVGYEEAVRVPMVVRYPAVLDPSRHVVSDALVSNVDIAATIMDAVGIPWDADGVSLLPLLRGTTASVRDGLLIEWCEATRSTDRCRPGEGMENLNDVATPPFFGIETDRYVFIRYQTGETELYDLTADPYELTNLAGRADQAALVEQLGRRLDDLVAAPAEPRTTVSSGPRGTVSPGPVRFVFFSQRRGTGFECRLDGPGQSGQWSACDGGSQAYPALEPGSYTFEVRATDPGGAADPTPATRAFRISSL
jgi:arylsulfatase A-like enzyme